MKGGNRSKTADRVVNENEKIQRDAHPPSSPHTCFFELFSGLSF